MAKQRTWTGHSGQNAVKAELLFRQCNVAVPEVDLGTDVFAFRDARPEMARIQVKTAQGRRYKNEAGYSATFHVPLKQLEIPEGALGDFFGPGTTVGIPFAAQLGVRVTF